MSKYREEIAKLEKVVQQAGPAWNAISAFARPAP